jgi:hypothetical protein
MTGDAVVPVEPGGFDGLGLDDDGVEIGSESLLGGAREVLDLPVEAVIAEK